MMSSLPWFISPFHELLFTTIHFAIPWCLLCHGSFRHSMSSSLPWFILPFHDVFFAMVHFAIPWALLYNDSFCHSMMSSLSWFISPFHELFFTMIHFAIPWCLLYRGSFCGIAMIYRRMGFRGASLEYGVMQRVSKYNHLGAAMSLGLPGGVSLRITYVKVTRPVLFVQFFLPSTFFSHGRFQRSNQAFSFPILLSNDLLPAPVFYGTITPLIAYACVKSLYLLPQWKAYITE